MLPGPSQGSADESGRGDGGEVGAGVDGGSPHDLGHDQGQGWLTPSLGSITSRWTDNASLDGSLDRHMGHGQLVQGAHGCYPAPGGSST